MSAAIASPRPARHRRAATTWAPAGRPLLAVVGNPDLARLALHFVLSRPGARAVRCGQAEVVGFLGSNAVDLILLDIDSSLLAGLALAAHLRAAQRGRGAGAGAALVAATSSEC